jgi:hypothetical protein
VTGAGSPLANATVTVLDAATGHVLASTTTDTSGAFHVDGLPAGQIKIRAASSGWLTTFANGRTTLAGADVLTLLPGEVLQLPDEMAMIRADCAIEGEVLGWMDPLGYATVTVLNADTGQVLRSVRADGNGHYRVGGLPAGPIKVRASKPGWLTSYANGQNTLADADVFTLTAGQTLTQQWDPLVLYLDLTPEAVVEGQVLGQGEPLAAARVSVLDAETGRVLRSVTSDANGSYRIDRLAPGPVKLRATKPGWLPSFANGQQTLITADTLTLEAGQTLTNSLLDLTAEGAIQGSVLGINDDPVAGWDDPLTGVTVTAIDATTGRAVRSVTTDALGMFRIGGLPAGEYKVRAAMRGWLTTFADGRASLATADVFAVAAGQTVQLPSELVLWAEAAIEGEVLGWMDPLGYATVTVLNADTGQVLRSVRADGNGHYRVGGLPAGPIKVRASKPGWLTSYANGQNTLADADVFTLTAGQTLTQQWDPLVLYLDLTPEAVITGSVMEFGNDPISGYEGPLGGVRVTALDAVTGRVLRSATTDAAGEFRIGGLTSGDVKLRVSKPGWLTTFFSDRRTFASADILTVTAGQAVSTGVIGLRARSGVPIS